MSHSFVRKARLGFFLAWLPMTGLVAALLAAAPGLGWLPALALALPLGALYALICGASWYMARALPLRRTSLARLLTTYLGAASTAAGLWVGLFVLAGRIAPAAWRTGLAGQLTLIFGMGGVYFLLSVAFHYIVLAMEGTRVAEQDALAAESLARQAELKALQAQLNPHFLFNSLNSIAALVSQDPDRAREMCLLLSGFLRASLGQGERDEIPLADELDLARQYLAIEQVRFGERLRVAEAVEEDLAALPVPALILQPLVENAVKHGIAGLVEGGLVRIAAHQRGPRLILSVESPYDPESGERPGAGHGLAILRQRLRARYGKGAGLDTQRADGRFVARLEIDLEARP